jgi:hypothetical protein
MRLNIGCESSSVNERCDAQKIDASDFGAETGPAPAETIVGAIGDLARFRLNGNILSPRWGWRSDAMDTPGFRPGLNCFAPLGLLAKAVVVVIVVVDWDWV